MLSDFYKNNHTDTIWWAEEGTLEDGVWYPNDGEMLFSFDKKKVFNLFRDYPQALTAEQKAVFDRENPYWADFFKDREVAQ